jgi:hypothetical protein
MNTTELFGIQFALKFKFKAQIIADFDRWKAEKQWFLSEERNKVKLFERVVYNYKKQHPKDHRPTEEIASELWENLKVQVARTNWQQVYDEILGNDYELPNYDGSPHIKSQNVKRLLFEYNCRHYYFTDSALQECEKIHITEPIDMEWLCNAANEKRQLNFGDQFIRYEKRGNRIIALAASFTRRQEQSYLQHSFLTLNLKKQETPPEHEPIVDLMKEECDKEFDDYSEAFDKKSLLLLYKMITFLDFIPLKQIKLPAGRCLEADSLACDKDNTCTINNSENIAITVVTVDANWNCSVFIEETYITGYFKNVLCGKGRTKIKRRFVKSHPRKGYERPAGKLKAART